MAPKFYWSPVCPHCRVADVVAEALGVELDKQYIDLSKKEQLSEEYVKINPLHKVPFLIDGDLKLGESRAIIQYLADKYASSNGKETLYPNDADKRAQINELLFFDVCTVYPNLRKLFFPVLFGNAKEFDPESEKAYRETLQYLEYRLKENGGKKFLTGDDLTIADISLVVMQCVPEAINYDTNEFAEFSRYKESVKGAIPRFQELYDSAQGAMMKHFEANLGRKV